MTDENVLDESMAVDKEARWNKLVSRCQKYASPLATRHQAKKIFKLVKKGWLIEPFYMKFLCLICLLLHMCYYVGGFVGVFNRYPASVLTLQIYCLVLVQSTCVSNLGRIARMNEI